MYLLPQIDSWAVVPQYPLLSTMVPLLQEREQGVLDHHYKVWSSGIFCNSCRYPPYLCTAWASRTTAGSCACLPFTWVAESGDRMWEFEFPDTLLEGWAVRSSLSLCQEGSRTGTAVYPSWRNPHVRLKDDNLLTSRWLTERYPIPNMPSCDCSSLSLLAMSCTSWYLLSSANFSPCQLILYSPC